MANVPKTDRAPALIRLPVVRARTGLSTTQLYRLAGGGLFPKQVPLGAQSVAWLEAEVDAWIAARVAEREHAPPRPAPRRRRASGAE